MIRRFVIKGFIPVTLLDYPGMVSAMVFTSGCNFRCPFCYNKELVLTPEKLPEISQKEIFNYLTKRRNWLDGVVIGGGEPTIWPGLADFCRKIKLLGYKIQLQTNGSNPQVIKKLLDNNFLDYIAMDIKGPLKKYRDITKTSVSIENIKKSSKIIKQNYPKIEAEFRTTIVPTLINEKDIEEIGKDFGGDVPYFLQQFENAKTLDPRFEKVKPYSSYQLKKMEAIAKRYFKKVEIRGLK